MGRNRKSGHVPQRSRLVANRELNRALQVQRPKPFGIRRTLDFVSQATLLDKVKEAQDDGAISERLSRRRSLHVTELPMRKLDAQLSRGLIIGYEFGRASAAIESDLKDDFPKRLEVSIGRVAFFRKHALGIHVESDELEREYRSVRELMGRIGMKGALRDSPPLHITLADELGGDFISKQEKYRAVGVLEEMLPVGEVITLNPLEFYPVRAAAA